MRSSPPIIAHAAKPRDFATAANCHQCRAAARRATCTWSRWRRAQPNVETLQSCKRTASPGSGKCVRIAGIATFAAPLAASCVAPPLRQAAVARPRVRRARTDVGTSPTEGARNRYVQFARITESGARSTTSSVRGGGPLSAGGAGEDGMLRGVWAGRARAGLDVQRLEDRRAGAVGGAGLPRHAPQRLRLCAARQGRGVRVVRMPHGQRRSRQSIIAFRAWSSAERGGRARPLSGWYGTALSTRSPRYLAL